MTGKEKCALLRQIRREIAEANDIIYLSPECNYPGDDCPGTCPKCDAEIRYLDAELNRRAAEGGKITLAGLSLSTYQQKVSSTPKISDFREVTHTAGYMVPNDPPVNHMIPPPPPPEIPILPAGVMMERDPVLDKSVRELPLPMLLKMWLSGENICSVDQLRDLVKYNPQKLQQKNRLWYADTIRVLGELKMKNGQTVLPSPALDQALRNAFEDDMLAETGVIGIIGEEDEDTVW